MVLAQEVVIVCLCLKDTEIHATSKQGNTTNSALESLHSLQRARVHAEVEFKLQLKPLTHADVEKAGSEA